MNSHIQIPKCVFKEFAKDNNGFFKYNIKTKIISRGYPKTTLTEEDYYSEEMEKTLNKKIETPLRQLLDFSKEIIAMNTFVPITEDILQIALTYAKSVIARSPNLYDSVIHHSIYFQFTNKQNQHDVTVSYAMRDETLKSFFDKYDISFMINQTACPLVLPTRGIYDFRINKVQCLCVPINPECAVLFKEKGKHIHVDQESDSVITIIPNCLESFVMRMNAYAFHRQKGDMNGYVICHQKNILELLKESQIEIN